MRKLVWILIGMLVGSYIFNIYLIVEIKNEKAKNLQLQDDNDYLIWQLNEVPTIIESHKEEICR
ncbi:MAG: hypothetical protein IJ568_05490 [Bacilli bacterium]|nr:hypothetical protein [Bacilli bacterium]